MNIEYLKSFYQTVLLSSVSQAAKTLHLTQSALSQQLKALEKNIGTQLLIRSNKGVNLTEAGKIVYKYAETFLSLYENMNNELSVLQESNIHEIKISSCASVALYSLPCTLYIYKKQHNDVKISVKSTNTDSVITDIQNKTADLGFIEGYTNVPNIACDPIAENKLVLVCAVNSKFSHIHEIGLHQLKPLPLILTPNICSIRKVFNEAISSIGIKPAELNVEIELESIESIKSSVIAGQSMAVLPYVSVKKELYAGILKIIYLKDVELTCQFSMIYQKAKEKEKYVNSFIEYIKKYGRESFC